MKLMNTVVSKVYSMKKWQKVTAFILMFVIFVAGLGVIFVQSQVGKIKRKKIDINKPMSIPIKIPNIKR